MFQTKIMLCNLTFQFIFAESITYKTRWRIWNNGCSTYSRKI